ncbi:MAG: hypothetical protein WCP55_15235 [Lentisphaerota bacterium]
MLEKDIIERLKKGDIQLPPLKILSVSIGGIKSKVPFDAVLKVIWNNAEEEFVAELKSPATPKNIRDAILSVKDLSAEMKLNPMIIVPYLSEDAMKNLEREGVSGIDLCGNGLIIVLGRFYFSKYGNKNQFPSSAPIKNIYSRNSSIVGRVFLVRPKFSKVGEILDEINRRTLPEFKGNGLSLSTVSKCLKSMEQDLIAGRDDKGIRLIQADKLMEKLSGNYVPPKVSETINWEIPSSGDGKSSVMGILSDVFKRETPAVISGSSSATRYSVMQGSETISVYSSDPDAFLNKIPGKRNDRFPSLSFIRTDDMPAYFDCRTDDNGIKWASPVQSYFELMSGDKRDRETAIQVRDYILTSIKGYKYG